jgi:protein-tyrosine phosphatase
MTYTVLFVCAGNIGRSPLAEVMARRFLAEALGVGEHQLEANGIRVLSAGTLAPPGVQASPRASAVAEEIGITIGRHPSQHLSATMAAQADVIFGMETTHIDHLAQLGFGDKAALLDPGGRAIPDPRHQDLGFYREVRDHIAVALQRRIPQILANAGRDMDAPDR